MKLFITASIITTSLILTSCARSPDTHFYVLNPIQCKASNTRQHASLRIGLDEINIPSYMYKTQIVVHDSSHRVKLNEFHQWAGSLDKNIQRVVETNLSTLLPEAAIASFPWGNQLKPNHQLHIDISQFDIDNKGNSTLRANYFIYANDELRKKRTVCYHSKLKDVSIDNLVTSMNANLEHLTRDIAKDF